MIIYGWSSKSLKQAPLENYECDYCGEKRSVLVIFARYVHIFWIPLFPFKKSAIIVCTTCKKEIEDKSIDLGSGITVGQLKSKVPMPIYLFTGLAFILVAIGFFTYTINTESKQKDNFIASPRIGDVYLIKSEQDTSKYNHFLIKVREIHGDSLWISQNSYRYNGYITKLDPNDGFFNMMYSVHKSIVKELDKKGELQKIFRDYTESTGFNREIDFQTDSLGVEESH